MWSYSYTPLIVATSCLSSCAQNLSDIVESDISPIFSSVQPESSLNPIHQYHAPLDLLAALSSSLQSSETSKYKCRRLHSAHRVPSKFDESKLRTSPMSLPDATPLQRPLLRAVSPTLIDDKVPKERGLAEQPVKKPFTCSICKKKFGWKSKLTRHMKVHSNNRPFKCLICDRALKDKDSLTTHMRIHSGERPFKCFTCRKTFALNSDLVEHTARHFGEGSFACPTCNKVFGGKSNLAVHMVVHSSVRPYRCSNCDSTFKTRGSLKAHMAVHSDEKPLACSLCDKAFKRKSNLTRHVKRMHR